MTTVLRFLWNSYTRPFVGMKNWLVGSGPGKWEAIYFLLGFAAFSVMVMILIIMLVSQCWWLILVVMPLGRVANVCSERHVDLLVYGRKSKYYRRPSGS